MKYLKAPLGSLRAQMILAFVSLVLLTAAATGVPAIWLLSQQLEQQAWTQVEQGNRATRALYIATENEAENLATLIAQRPTLHNLLSEGDRSVLQPYLQTLKSNAGLDLILICSGHRQLMGQAGELAADNLCTISGFYVPSTETKRRIWYLAAQPVETESANPPASVIVGIMLDQKFVEQMRDQTGLEHTLLINGQAVATSLADGPAAHGRARLVPSDTMQRSILTVNGRPHYVLRMMLAGLPDKSTLEAEVALPIANIAATQRNLAWALSAGIIAVAAAGSILGVLLARHISRPLATLARAAAALSQGDLARSVMVDTQVREVAQVGAALEAARVDLNLTLSEKKRKKIWTDHLLEAIVEGIVTLDSNGHIIFFSKGAERITGWSRDEVLGRACDETFQAVGADKPFSQLVLPPQQRHKVKVILRDGLTAILAVTSAQLRSSEEAEARWVLVFRDVSESEAMHRVMGHFMANVTHEFRTPLSSLAASIELLLDQAPDLSTAELQELISSLRLGIVGLQTLVDNLLEGASIEAGRFRVNARPVKLSHIIHEATHTMEPLLKRYGQQLVLELPPQLPVVLADPRRTVQVLVNLLSNASKYGPDEAEIVLEITAGENQVRVSVADRGPGIPVEYRDDLFRRFVYPAQSNDKVQYGAGLGLSVVKAVVEAQQGQVGVEDRPGGGSIFWFTLVVEKLR